MLISFLSQLLSSWFAFLLPSFYTFKALAHGPIPGPEIERWSKYWTVIGAMVALEYVAERAISWLPFYWEMKTLFLLYLSLPQTEGSTHIYDMYLQPFFLKNEAELDAGIINLQRSVFTFMQARLTGLLEIIGDALNKFAASRQAAPGQPAPSNTSSAFSMDTIMSLLSAYSPALMKGSQTQPQSTTAPVITPAS